ncbi:hypothetical protein BDN72DRAFT_842309 [Pluteus cervinus]|uniref:Uncharacterized protein n=1 Tax=Pluteus cervinus TaxID=181527 RepID=A0ACD3AQ74_9AGAR|nr:hypothetical protein BDN72DRAFT_842309 [Pluteus cervinus]
MAGPTLIGCAINWFLFGALVVQVYDYHTLFSKKDRTAILALVYSVFFIEIIQTALVTDSVWDYVVRQWGTPATLTTCPSTAAPIVVFNTTIAAIVQSFFAWRIAALRKGTGQVAAICIFLISLVAWVSGLIFADHYRDLGEGLDKIIGLFPVVITWLALSFSCDCLIAVVMVYILSEARNAAELVQTKVVVKHLIIHAIESGVATAIVAALQLAFFLTMPTNLLHISQLYILGRLYSNVLLASLNGRHRMRTLSDDSTP